MKKSIKTWFIYLILSGLILKLLKFLFRKKCLSNFKDNLSDFVKKEKNEVEELAKGKESFNRFCSDTSSIFVDYFIPCDSNDNRPKILRPKPLLILVILLILLKAGVTGYLFFIYPNLARMQENITKEIFTLTNQARIENNLPALTYNPELNAAALAKANDMLSANYFAHFGPDGKKPWDWINRESYQYLFVGENLAMNFSGAQSAHLALMQSDSHKKNILNNKYNDIGLAVVSGEINNIKTNLLVELFGSQKTRALVLDSQPAISVNLETVPEPNELSVTKTEVLAEENIQSETEIESAPLPGEDSGQQKEDDLVSEKITSQNSPEEIALSPNLTLENNPAIKIAYFASVNDKKINLASQLISLSKYIYIAILILITVVLLINIIIRISVQHKPVIIQTLLVILFITGLISIKLHFLENVLDQVAVL